MIVGVKFLLKGNQFLSVGVTPDEFDKIKDRWCSPSQLRLEGMCEDPVSRAQIYWSVRCAEIAAIHTFDYDTMLRQLRTQTQQQGGYNVNPMSGV